MVINRRLLDSPSLERPLLGIVPKSRSLHHQRQLQRTWRMTAIEALIARKKIAAAIGLMLPTNPILRFTDSTGSSKLVEAPTFCPITTRFDNFTLSEIPTKKSLNNLTRLHHQIKAPADIFTKPLDETSFTSLRNLTKLLLSPSTKHRLQSASTDLFHVSHHFRAFYVLPLSLLSILFFCPLALLRGSVREVLHRPI